MALFLVGCSSPTAPAPVLAQTPATAAPTPPAVSVPPTLPDPPLSRDTIPATNSTIRITAQQQKDLSTLMANLTKRARTHITESPGRRVYLEIVAPDTLAHVFAELRHWNAPSNGEAVLEHAVAVPNALKYPNKESLLRALETAVTYKAEVRLVNGPISCCLSKPAIAVTGRLEAVF